MRTTRGKKRIVSPLNAYTTKKPVAGRQLVRLRLSKSTQNDLRRALAKKRGAIVFFDVTAADAAGNSIREQGPDRAARREAEAQAALDRRSPPPAAAAGAYLGDMAEIAPAATLTGMWCPRCGERALDAARDAPAPATVRCAACGAEHEAIADVTVISDRVRHVGGCCAGFARHELQWRDAAGDTGGTRFETWVQDRVVLRPGDRASLIFPPGDLRREKGLPMPLTAAEPHALRQLGAAGIVRRRAAALAPRRAPAPAGR